VEAQTAEMIKRYPEDYGLENATDKIAFPVAFKQKKVQKEFKEYMKWFALENTLQKAVSSLESKTHLIKGLIQLWLNNYYAVIEVKEDTVKNDPEFKIRKTGKIDKGKLKKLINKMKED
jgi:hypothetical protein